MTDNLRISIITPDFSNNCVARAVLIAELLSDRNKVEIIGPAFRGGVWFPMQKPPDNVTYNCIPVTKSEFYPGTARRLVRSIDADVIIVSKAVLPSMFVAVLIRIMKKAPMIIDIDDWELGFVLERFGDRGIGNSIKTIFNIVKLMACEFIAGRIKFKIVSNTYLQRKYGGVIIPHVRNTRAFNPSNFERTRLRAQHAIGEHTSAILFMGTPRRHKGLDELLKAFRMIDGDDIILMLAGFDLENEYQKSLHDEIKTQLGEKCRIFGQQPFDKIPEFLAMSDLVVIPQRKTYSSSGQIPAKLFDAMAMERPIIASRVNDIPEILKNCGWTYESGNIEELAEKIKYALANPAKAEFFAKEARRKCVAKYSYEAMKPKMDELLKMVSASPK